MYILIEILIFLILVTCYIIAPDHISAPYLLVVVLLVVISYLLLYFNNKTRKIFKNHFLSISNLFLLLFFVVCFQFPIDYILGNSNINYENYFFSFRTINKSVTFDALCFVSFIIGCVIINKNKPNPIKNNIIERRYSMLPTKGVLRIMYVLWIGFILFLNKDYINAGHGVVPVNSISIAFYGYFWRTNIFYLAICVYNARKQRLSFKNAIMNHSLVSLTLVIVTVVLFLLANNRVYVFYLAAPMFFYFLSVTCMKTKPMISLLILGCAGVFFTLFKIYGVENMFTEGNMNVGGLQGYDRFASVSPFTSELAGSILADSALFYLWYKNGIVVFGSTLVLGFLRSISGLVPLFYSLTDLSNETYDSGVYITRQLSASYGLGSSVSGDLIVSLGFIGSLVVMFLFGRLCMYGDTILFSKSKNLKGILIALCISSQVLFVARASLCDTIATILFCLLFLYFYNNKIRSIKSSL